MTDYAEIDLARLLEHRNVSRTARVQLLKERMGRRYIGHPDFVKPASWVAEYQPVRLSQEELEKLVEAVK
jgi:hypothetical protein